MAYDGGGWGAQRWLFGNYLLSQSRERKRHLEVSCSLQMHEEYFACACHSILSAHTHTHTSAGGAYGNRLFSNRLHLILLTLKSSNTQHFFMLLISELCSLHVHTYS